MNNTNQSFNHPDIQSNQLTGNNPSGIQLAVRVNTTNPTHHLWNNNGTWWCHLTIHHADYTTERLRVSLKTRDLKEAMLKRDRLFQKFLPSAQSAA